ncbi:MAG: GNAT family N-acetyltransferase [Crocinitomicaceae bacterium]
MKIRKAHSIDRDCIADIYEEVAGKVQGITRRPEEITDTYIFSLLNKPEEDCVFLVVEDDNEDVVGFGHAEKSNLAAYSHILNNFTIVVSPDAQKGGIGRGIFMGFLEHIFNERPDISRLEMEVQYDEDRIKLFEAVGFNSEAVIKGRVKGIDGKYHDQVLMAWINPNFKA